MKDVSVCIAARNEEFLARTVEGVLKNKRADTEVIVVCDGNWPKPPIVDDPDVILIYHSKSIGQRQAVNEAVKLSTAKYVMKLDAHCILDEGFDVKLIADCEYTWTVVPRMYNLHGFDWVCKADGERLYQRPSDKAICPKCGKKMEREIIWKPRWHKRSDFMRFDSDLHFQYWGGLGDRPESKGDLAETMSFVGACFFMYRKRYWELDGSEESWGSWGQQGTEWACKTWLSGGKVMVNKKTWFAHLFRTQGGDFGFPYPQSGKQVEHARKMSKEFFLEGKWSKAIHPLSWLIQKFAPVPGWENHPFNKIEPNLPLAT
jgi:glycosyltransferase involved in cell wall biosynthesis